MPNVLSPRDLVSRPESMDETVQHTGYTTFFMLNSAEHEILNAHKYQNSVN